jgi:signal transduction histidine kinase
MAAALSAAAFVALRSLQSSSAALAFDAGEDLLLAARLRAALEREVADEERVRHGDAGAIAHHDQARRELLDTISRLQPAVSTGRGHDLLAAIERSEAAHERDRVRVDELARTEPRAAAALVASTLGPEASRIEELVEQLEQHKTTRLAEAAQRQLAAERYAFRLVLGGSVAALLAVLATAVAQVRAARRAEQIDRHEEFLSVASHDLKSPLTALRLEVDLLRRQKHADVRELAAKMQRQVTAMSELVARLLDVSRIQAGRLTLERERVDLSELAEASGQRLRDELQLAGASLSVRTPGPVVGDWDRVRLAQVINNLLSNAIKYGKHGPVDLEVEATEALARVRVRDRGDGIAPALQATLFERFARAPATAQGGHGLGLWIARNIVEAHGGRIWVESKSGEGAVFIVELPRTVPSLS